jgi:hypothetical protein
MRSTRPIDSTHETHGQASVKQGVYISTQRNPARVCVFITAGPITKLCAWGRRRVEDMCYALQARNPQCPCPSWTGPWTQPHAQRRPSLDQMGVPRLHLSMAPGIRSALARAGLALGVYVRRNFRPRGAITARRPRVPVSVILARPHPSQQAASFLACTRPPDFVASRRSSTAAALPTDSGPRVFRGLNLYLEGFLPLPSEGYNISKARTSSMADLLDDDAF